MNGLKYTFMLLLFFCCAVWSQQNGSERQGVSAEAKKIPSSDVDQMQPSAAPPDSFAVRERLENLSDTDLENAQGIDVRIGTRGNVKNVILDSDVTTGNLFAALQYSDYYWTVNISTDGGQSWNETYQYSSGSVINDISATVLHGFFYVAFTSNANQQARLRRFWCTSGSPDGTYGEHQVFWPESGITILDVAIASTEYYPTVNVLEYMAILSNNSIVHYESNDAGWTWKKWGTPFTNGSRGLDAHINQPITSATELAASYISTDNRLHVIRWMDGFWLDRNLEASSFYSSDKTSIAAYEERIMVVHRLPEGGGWPIKYWVSYDGGDTWPENGYVAQGINAGQPHVAGRNGGGFRVVYYQETGGEPDILWTRHRDYGTGPGTANFDTPVQVNETDISTGAPISVEWIPNSHGIVWIGPTGVNGAWFDKISTQPVTVFFDNFENGINGWTYNSPWGQTTISSYSPTHSWTDSPNGNYGNNVNRAIWSPAINLSNYTAATLTFWHRYDFESSYDFGRVWVTTDNGAIYTQLASFTGTQSSWIQSTVNLNAFVGKPSVKLVFQLVSDGSITRDGWYIDDVKVTSGSTGTNLMRNSITTETPNLPKSFSLSENFPNPFNPSTTIRYAIPTKAEADIRILEPGENGKASCECEGEPVRVTLRVYDVLGQVVKVLVDEDKKPGSYAVQWDGTNAKGQRVGSGVYIYTLAAGNLKAAKRMTMLK